MKQKDALKIIVLFAILYFIWLFVVALNEVMNGGTLLLELKMWAIIGVVLYALFLLVEVVMYLTVPKEESREIKLVSEAITRVMCSNCKTTFTISDTGVRPMPYTCPNCGKEGALKGKKVEGSKMNVTCPECSASFEIMDTGERPLTYECPYCHHHGVVETCSEPE